MGFFRLNAIIALIKLILAMLFLFIITNSEVGYLSGSVAAAISWLSAELIGALYAKYLLHCKIISINSLMN